MRAADLPRHLRVNYRAVDATGGVIAESRDLEEVQARVRDSLRANSGRARTNAPVEGWNRDGLIDWDFDELPHSIETGREGRSVTVFPALVDNGTSVDLRTFETPEAAQRATRLGLSRLYAIRCRRELKWNLKREPGFERLILLFSPLGDAARLESHLSSLIARSACVEDKPAVRNAIDFESRLDPAWNELADATSDLITLTDSILAGAHAVLGRLEQPAPEAWRPTLADVNDQLGRLNAVTAE